MRDGRARRAADAGRMRRLLVSSGLVLALVACGPTGALAAQAKGKHKRRAAAAAAVQGLLDNQLPSVASGVGAVTAAVPTGQADALGATVSDLQDALRAFKTAVAGGDHT